MEKLNLGPRKIFRAPALRRGKESVAISDRVKLERVLGFTVSSNAAFDCDPNTGTIAYPAGCVVVLHSIWQNQQVHILSSSKKSITSLAFSLDGKYLVTGECGHLPYARVWDVNERSQVAEFQGHKYGINCVAFSPNLKYVISVGSQHDMIVNVWDWKNNVKIASNKVSCKVKAVSFASNGNYFVTVGNRHVKFWYLQYCRSTKYKLEPVPLMGRSAILGDQRNNYFFDVACGKGTMTESTYAITKSGLLCEFNSRRLLDKWVELRTTNANCISVGEHFIFIGCAEGVVRCFSPTHLNFICTLPCPHFLGVDITKGLNSNKQVSVLPTSFMYPDTIALALDEANKKVSCMYSDHSFYVWDIKDLKKVNKTISFLYHSACIWGIEKYPELPSGVKGVLPKDTFVTFSSDDTIRFWNLGFPLFNDFSPQKNSCGMELLKVLYTDPELTYICEVDISSSGSSDKADTACDGKNGVRCLKISPDGKHLASGDRTGNIRIHDLELWEELCKIEAHDSEVLCLEYSKPICIEGEEKKYLASASRDRLIHVFDVNHSYSFQETLDDHSSSITAVRFVHTDGQLQMISCGADKSIIFRRAHFNPSLSLLREHHVVGKTTLYDMEVDDQQQQILTACQDRNIRMYSFSTGKHGRCFRGSQGEDGTLIKVVLDPSGSYIVSSCTDKSLYLYDYLTGECLATMFGHSELVTGLTFTNDGQNLISVSGDGCIFIWRLPFEISQTILSKRLSYDPVLPNLKQDQRKGENVHSQIRKKVESNGLSTNQYDAHAANISSKGDIPSAYRFSIGQLPLWAKKQMNDEFCPTTSVGKPAVLPLMPANSRWAHRFNNEGLVVKSYLESDSVIPFPNSAEHQIELQSKCTDKVKPEADIGKSLALCAVSKNNEEEQLDDKNIPHANLQIEDIDADQEHTVTAVCKVVSSPCPVDGSEVLPGSFQCSDSDDQKPQLCAKSDIEIGSDNLPAGLTTDVSTPEDLETNSEDDDANTPLDGEKSLLSYLCVSSENLERLGLREKFMKNNYESLSFENSFGAKHEKENDISLRHSLSTKFLCGSSPFKLSACGNDSEVQLFKQDDVSCLDKQSEPKKRGFQARGKLNMIVKCCVTESESGRRPLFARFSPFSSVSICDLYSMPYASSSKNSRKTEGTIIRRVASMNDLPNVCLCDRNFSVIQEDNKCNDGAEGLPKRNLCDAFAKESALYSQSHISTSSLNTSNTRLEDNIRNKEESKKSASPHWRRMASFHSNDENFKTYSCTIHPSPSICYDDVRTKFSDTFSRCTAYVKKTSSANRAVPEKLNSLKSKNYNLLDTPLLRSCGSISVMKTLSKPISDLSNVPEHFMSPNVSILSTHSSGSNGAVIKPVSALHSFLSPPVKDTSVTSSESCSPKLPKMDISNHWTESTPIGSSNSWRSENSEKSGLPLYIPASLPEDPQSVPLTKDLCLNINENLSVIAMYAKQVFQRISSETELSPEEKVCMLHTLFQGILHTQQILFEATIPYQIHVDSTAKNEKCSKTSLKFPNPFLGGELLGKSHVQNSFPNIEPKKEDVNTITFLEDFSDKLLNIIEKKLNDRSSSNN